MLPSWIMVLMALTRDNPPFTRRIVIHNDTRYISYAQSAIVAMQTWYRQDTGLWEITGWWNSANALTTLADFASMSPDLDTPAHEVYQNTFVKAQLTDVNYKKVMTSETIESQESQSLSLRTNSSGFLNDYYDDEGWWALAWLKVYDNTKQSQYLHAAKFIFEDMTTGWNAPCGGMWWDKAHTYTGAIENELFFTVAAQLANRESTSTEREHYLNWALTQLDWFQQSGMINPNHTINNGLDMATCRNDNGTIWSYNQGVVLGGLAELHRAFPNPTYLALAEKIALAAIDHLSDSDGILHDPCEPACGNDGPQFKGIFMRNLQLLQAAHPNRKFEGFIRKNADSIWLRNRGNGDQLGLVWTGPFTGATASTQSSACDALVAALARDSTY